VVSADGARDAGQVSRSNPHIQVFYTLDPENLDEKMMADFEAGTAPDVFAGCCDFFPIWHRKAHPRPASLCRRRCGWGHDPGVGSGAIPVALHREGLQYGLPKYHGALALYYNKDLFDEHGVAYPNADWTYGDYLEAMQRLTDDRDGDDQTDLWGSMADISWERIQVHANGWGGHFVDPEDPTHCMMAQESRCRPKSGCAPACGTTR